MSVTQYRVAALSLAGLWLMVALNQGATLVAGLQKGLSATGDEIALALQKREKLQATLLDIEQELSRYRIQSTQAMESLGAVSQELVLVIDSAARQSKVSVQTLSLGSERTSFKSSDVKEYQLRVTGDYNGILKFVGELSQAHISFLVSEVTMVARDWRYPSEPLEAWLRFEPIPLHTEK